MIDTIITALWLIIPAYVANSSAVLFKGKTPIDLGKNFIDKKRILGSGKTYRGFLGGFLSGTVVGLIQILLSQHTGLPDFNQNILIVASLAFGAMAGDSFFSFIKRRIGLKRGYPFPVIDQIDFLIVAISLNRIIYPTWFFEAFSLDILLILFLVTPGIHLFINYVGYKIGKKEEPW